MDAALVGLAVVILGLAAPRVTASFGRALRTVDPAALAAAAAAPARPVADSSAVATLSTSVGAERREQELTAELLSGAISGQQYREALGSMLGRTGPPSAPLRPAR